MFSLIHRAMVMAGALVLAAGSMVGTAAASAAPPTLTFTPSPYDYGNVTAGQTASQTFTLTNTGGRASGAIKTISLSPQQPFTTTADTCTGRSLGPNKSCTITVQFAPTSSGTNQSTLTATAVHARATHSLTGTGTAPGATTQVIYWTLLGEGGIMKGTIGTDPKTLASGYQPSYGVAVNDSHIYWTNFGDGKVYAANTDGSGVNTLESGQQGQNLPAGVAVDDSNIYWSDLAGDGAIKKANLDGTDSGVITLFTGHSRGLAVDGSHIYWTNADDGTIYEASLNGSGMKPLVTGQNAKAGIAVDGSHIYWTNAANGTINEANLDGSGVTPLVYNQSSPTGVAVDDSNIYWANWNGSDGRIQAADLDGHGGTTVFDLGDDAPYGVAVGGYSTAATPVAYSCTNLPPASAGYTTINGTDAANTLTGTSGNNVILAKGGNDVINGGGGNDIICGGDGNDVINAGTGNDTIDGGDGNNTINAGNGNNTVTTNAGNDVITTGTGNDKVNAGNGNNTVTTNAGDDTITTGTGNDTINAGAGNDTVTAGTGRNTITGAEH
ncbi:DUF5050 domain-containing protein [Streptomyces sp. NPDC055085]